VSENALHAADLLLVPLIPTTLSLHTFDQLTEFLAGLEGSRPRVLAFFSMVDRRKRLHREIVERLPTERADIAAAAIPALSVVEQMTVHRAPVPAFAPRSPAAQGYEQLWAELRQRMG
jgi:cellulose biosynthesis protein BcsQ